MVRFLADAHSFAADLADIDGFAPSEAIACARVIPHSALRLSADEIIPDAVPAAARGALTCEPKADHSAPMQIFQTMRLLAADPRSLVGPTVGARLHPVKRLRPRVDSAP